MKPGGKILLSPDITPPPNGTVRHQIQGFIKTLWQRYNRIRMVNRAIQGLGAMVDFGWTIHPLGYGVYYWPSDQSLNQEWSFTVEILDVDSEFIEQAARALRQVFTQEAVVVLDYRTNTPKMIDS